MRRLPGEKDGGEITHIDKLMVGAIAFHKAISSLFSKVNAKLNVIHVTIFHIVDGCHAKFRVYRK